MAGLGAKARARVEAANAKAKDRISDLQEFVRRFFRECVQGAASDFAQESSWKRSRSRRSGRHRARNPYIRFEQGKKLYRSAGIGGKSLSFSYPGSDENSSQECDDQTSRAAERVAIIGPNGAGKTTLMRLPCRRIAAPLRGESSGSRTLNRVTCRRTLRLSSTTRTDLFFLDCRNTQAKPTTTRSFARPWADCFSRARKTKKSVKSSFRRREGTHDLRQADVDQAQCAADGPRPTNHMDMETIESLQIGLEHYPGTLIFVFARSRIRRRTRQRASSNSAPAAPLPISGATYDEYLKGQGIEA